MKRTIRTEDNDGCVVRMISFVILLPTGLYLLNCTDNMLFALGVVTLICTTLLVIKREY